MKTALVVLALTGCFQFPAPSNNPDSGVTCFASARPAGSGTTQGMRSFSVGSSYQHLTQTVPPDAGSVAGATLFVQLLQRALPCGPVATDGGDSSGDGLWLSLVAVGAARVEPGTYATSPASGPSLWGYAKTDAGLLPIEAGSITLTVITDCSASGSFELTLGKADAGPSTLSGTFESEYCTLR